MSMVNQRIEQVVADLKRREEDFTSPTMIMYEVMNVTMDHELTAWGSDIVDVAEKIEYFLTTGQF